MKIMDIKKIENINIINNFVMYIYIYIICIIHYIII
jgi:hypothetical protein